MLGKLLKYDLKWVYKVVIVFYILSLVFSILTRIMYSIENSLLFSVLGQIMQGVMVGLLINALFNGLIRSWVRFIQNVYKDESYLTHTLPVEKNNIYLSKVLTAIIISFTTVLVAIICLFIAFYSKGNLEILKGFLNVAASTYDMTVIGLILVIAVVVFLEILFISLIGYDAIIIGAKSNKAKVTKALILGIVLYLFTSGFTLVIVYLFGLTNPAVMNVINTTEIVNFDAMKTIMKIGIITYTVYNLIYYVIGRIEFSKGVNVD